jgi:signal peptidase II
LTKGTEGRGARFEGHSTPPRTTEAGVIVALALRKIARMTVEPETSAPIGATPAVETAPQSATATPSSLETPLVFPAGLSAPDAASNAPISSPWSGPQTGSASSGPSSGAPGKPASVALLVIVTVVSLAADLVSKWWAKSHLAGFDAVKHAAKRAEIWKGHMDFVFAQNPGGAWSFLRSLPDSLRRPFFLIVSAAAIVFIISVYQRVKPEQWAMKWGLPLALGGAMGNLVDRMRYGWVVDFVDIFVTRGGQEHHWPTFNVADIAIVVGVGLMAIDMMIGARRHAGIPA